MLWPSGRVVDCNVLILFRHSTTGLEHPLVDSGLVNFILDTYVLSNESKKDDRESEI